MHTHRHVLGRPSEGTRARADEVARDAKVAQLDDALSREEDVGRLDITVDDLLGMQVRETLQDLRLTVAVAPRGQASRDSDVRHERIRAGEKKGTHPLGQNTRDLLSHAAFAPSDLLTDSGEAAPLAQLHD